MSSDTPLILISNDDGVDAAGLHHLARLAAARGSVVVVAPSGPRSGMSSALTVDRALHVEPVEGFDGAEAYSCSGTPVDCVKLATHAVLSRKPDLMLSGINHGSNAAVNNIYSGTMGAAMEACVMDIPAVGLSLLDHSPEADFSMMLPWAEKVIDYVLAHGLPQGICLNVNFPARVEPQGIKQVRAARSFWTEQYRDYADPYGKPFYWLTGKLHNYEPDDPDTDEYWLHRGWGTLVPIRPDQTARDWVGKLKL